MDSRFSHRSPALNILALKHAGYRHLFPSCMVLYRLLLCMSFKKLESHRPHTFFCHSEGNKVLIVTFSPDFEHEQKLESESLKELQKA